MIKCFVLLPVPGSALLARFLGLYVVKQRVSDTHYIILTPERRRKIRLCQVNMLKSHFPRGTPVGEQHTEVSASMVCSDSVPDDGLNMPSGGQQNGRLSNSEFLLDVGSCLSYLPDDQRADVIQLLQSFPTLYSDVPSCTNVLCHDIDVGGAAPIKQHTYRCSFDKRQAMKAEVNYLVENGLAIPSHRPWSSPCLMLPKADGTLIFCTDFRKVNRVTVTDSFPLPHIED